jgi:chemotaxis protein methyltransferase CheR
MTRKDAAEERVPVRPLDDGEFAALAELLFERTGLLFSAQKRGEIESKLAAHLRENPGLAREELVGLLRSSDGELQRLVNRLTIGESYFFRNRPHFNALTADIIPGLIAANAASRRIRIWSAGCATGEEPYSLAILLEESFPDLRGWDVRITATDINTSFLERARQGLYTRWSFRGVEERLVEKYFRPEGGGYQRLDPAIARRVEFGWFNLSRPPFVGRVSAEPFDLVVCRNVLIYFSFELANRVVEALAQTLRPDGYLVVGHAESFPVLRELESVYSHAMYYYRRGDPRRARGAKAERLHTVSIPGIPVHDVARRPSAGPGRRRSSVAAAQQRKRHAPPPKPSVEQDNLLHDIEEAQEHADLGELAKAEAILERLLGGVGRLDHRVHFLRALVADQHDRTGDAIASLKQSIFLNKEFAIGHYYMGVICEREDDVKTAKRCFKNAVEIASRLALERVLDEGGGITAGVLKEIATERIRELELG